MDTLGLGPLVRIFGLLSHYMFFIIIIFFSGIFTDKEHVSPKLSLVNIPGLNYLLRSEIFVSEDG